MPFFKLASYSDTIHERFGAWQKKASWIRDTGLNMPTAHSKQPRLYCAFFSSHPSSHRGSRNRSAPIPTQSVPHEWERILFYLPGCDGPLLRETDWVVSKPVLCFEEIALLQGQGCSRGIKRCSEQEGHYGLLMRKKP